MLGKNEEKKQLEYAYFFVPSLPAATTGRKTTLLPNSPKAARFVVTSLGPAPIFPGNLTILSFCLNKMF